LWALRINVPLDDIVRLGALASAAEISFEAGGSRVFLNGEDVTAAIRTEEVSRAASKVSTVPGVRRAMVEKQRRMGEAASVVMEGRDIGTVVFPDAGLKVFLDASPEVRAARRAAELGQEGGAGVADEMRERDERDSRRAESPLVQAPDAVYLDSSSLSLEEVEAAILRLFRERVSNGKEILP
jgi:cytidylate kinase